MVIATGCETIDICGFRTEEAFPPLEVTPEEIVVSPGGDAVYNVSGGQILEVTGLPEGGTATFAPTSLIVHVSLNTPPGRYRLVANVLISRKSGTETKYANILEVVTLTVVESEAATPASPPAAPPPAESAPSALRLSIVTRSSTEPGRERLEPVGFAINVSRRPEMTETLQLSVTGVPPGLNVMGPSSLLLRPFASQADVDAGRASNLHVAYFNLSSEKPDELPARFTLNITATSGSFSETIAVPVSVHPK
jgi:hypothetical protein